MFTYISIAEFADGVVKNNKDANRRALIASLREALAAKKTGAGCMICGAPIWAAGSGVTGTYLCFRRGRRQRGLRDRINNTSAEHIAPRLLRNMAFLKLRKNIAFRNVLRVSKNDATRKSCPESRASAPPKPVAAWSGRRDAGGSGCGPRPCRSGQTRPCGL